MNAVELLGVMSVMCEGKVPYSCEESNAGLWPCELGICAYYGASFYLLHTIYAHPGIRYYIKMWIGGFVCSKFNYWQL